MTTETIVHLTAHDIADFIHGLEGAPDNFVFDYDEKLLPADWYDREDCLYGDAIGYILTHGGCIRVTDLWAEGEAHGNLMHDIDEDYEDGECVRYLLRLDDIERGMSNILDGKVVYDTDDGTYKQSLLNIMSDMTSGTCKADCIDNWNVMQAIIFNEVIYA